VCVKLKSAKRTTPKFLGLAAIFLLPTMLKVFSAIWHHSRNLFLKQPNILQIIKLSTKLLLRRRHSTKKFFQLFLKRNQEIVLGELKKHSTVIIIVHLFSCPFLFLLPLLKFSEQTFLFLEAIKSVRTLCAYETFKHFLHGK
jgi:hypothetical protein